MDWELQKGRPDETPFLDVMLVPSYFRSTLITAE